MKYFFIFIFIFIFVAGCEAERNDVPVQNFLNCIGVSTTIILLDKDDVSKAWKTTGKTLRIWEKAREYFVTASIKKLIPMGFSVKESELKVAQAVDSGGNIYQTAAIDGKIDVEPEIFKSATRNCLTLYGI
ncbi:MAG: hypothetical protein COA75_14855 [Cellvibrionales bacterium]|nr:MAG: hypothetical protein COA75_14855 [Cellvibrionales bacterium]